MSESGGVEEHLLAKNLMILASAGSGKTYQLGHRFIGMLREKEVMPERVVALTFTRKAASEFSDSIIQKLAHDQADFHLLEKFVQELPRLQFNTMDSFFSSIVRKFQYELGVSGGSFQLLQGAPLEQAMQEILASVLNDVLEGAKGEGFFHAFRRATMGSEDLQVLPELKKFVALWHDVWQEGKGAGFGVGMGLDDLPQVNDWAEQKSVLIASLRQADLHQETSRVLGRLEAHTIGSGSLSKPGVVLQQMLAQLDQRERMEVFFRKKEIGFDSLTSQKLRELLRLLAGCECAAASARTEAVGYLVGRIDAECERQLRQRGALTFNDVKHLLGAWTHDEEARLRRELVDYRLDASYDHWFLDEFQDTSLAEWDVLEPLLDEAASEGEGSLWQWDGSGDNAKILSLMSGGVRFSESNLS